MGAQCLPDQLRRAAAARRPRGRRDDGADGARDPHDHESRAREGRRRYDLTITLAIACLIYAVVEVPDEGWLKPAVRRGRRAAGRVRLDRADGGEPLVPLRLVPLALARRRQHGLGAGRDRGLGPGPARVALRPGRARLQRDRVRPRQLGHDRRHAGRVVHGPAAGEPDRAVPDRRREHGADGRRTAAPDGRRRRRPLLHRPVPGAAGLGAGGLDRGAVGVPDATRACLGTNTAAFRSAARSARRSRPASPPRTPRAARRTASRRRSSPPRRPPPRASSPRRCSARGPG